MMLNVARIQTAPRTRNFARTIPAFAPPMYLEWIAVKIPIVLKTMVAPALTFASSNTRAGHHHHATPNAVKIKTARLDSPVRTTRA
mmetsp:Transcript_5722/g.10418  ORF Transcript_5722/g.10418 Transcript_5722/m.10418 type:complete len:86 (+) Transcript_5722:87-344(+)